MFNSRYKKKNTNNLSPNFLSDLDSFVTPKTEAKKVLKPELKKNIIKEKKPFIKKKKDEIRSEQRGFTNHGRYGMDHCRGKYFTHWHSDVDEQC